MGSTNRQLLLHMLDYADQIEEANKMFDASVETLSSNSVYRNAVAMCVLQIGELAGKLTEDFRDATNRGVYTSSDNNINSGNAATSGIVQWGQEHALETTVDITCDLGKRDYYSGDSGAFVSGNKTYYRIFYNSNATFPANSVCYLRGSYRFYPVVE